MAFFPEVGAAVLTQVEFTSTEHVKKKGLPAAQSAAGKAAIPMIFPSRKRHPTTPPDKHARERRKMAFFQEVGAAVLAQVEFTSTEHVKKKGLPAAQSAAGKAAIPTTFRLPRKRPTTPPDKHAKVRRRWLPFKRSAQPSS
jgi:hypothetical protein